MDARIDRLHVTHRLQSIDILTSGHYTQVQ